MLTTIDIFYKNPQKPFFRITDANYCEVEGEELVIRTIWGEEIGFHLSLVDSWKFV